MCMDMPLPSQSPTLFLPCSCRFEDQKQLDEMLKDTFDVLDLDKVPQARKEGREEHMDVWVEDVGEDRDQGEIVRVKLGKRRL